MRWLKYQSRFNFFVTYHPRKEEGKPEALTRRTGDLPEQEDARLQYQSQTILKKENIEAKLCLFAGSIPNEPTGLDATFTKLMQEGYNVDQFPQKILKALKDKVQQFKEILLEECSNTNSHLYYRELLYVPIFDPFKLHILQQFHDAPSARHPGREKSFELITKDFY